MNFSSMYIPLLEVSGSGFLADFIASCFSKKAIAMKLTEVKESGNYDECALGRW